MNEYTNQENTYFTTQCSNCSEETKTPFEPINGSIVYCNACFKLKRGDNK